MFSYGFLAVVLVLYLDALGLDALQVGIVLTLTLIGDTLISLWLTTNADRLGRRRTLVAGSLLMVVAGLVFARHGWLPLLILAATIGVISPTGNEVGPFLAIEQAALVADRRRRRAGPRRSPGTTSRATSRPRRGRWRPGSSARPCSTRGGAGRRVPRDRHRLRALRGRDGGRLLAARTRHRGAAARAGHGRHPAAARARALARASSSGCRLLFSLDAFGGGFIPQSLMAYWFHIQYGVEPAAGSA